MPNQLQDQRVGFRGASDFSLRHALDRWGLAQGKDVAIIQVGGEPEGELTLQNKAVDAATISEPFTPITQREGLTVLNPTAPVIQTITACLAKTPPESPGLDPNAFIEPAIVRKIEDSGLMKKLYAK